MYLTVDIDTRYYKCTHGLIAKPNVHHTPLYIISVYDLNRIR